jgi:hypothetical protein
MRIDAARAEGVVRDESKTSHPYEIKGAAVGRLRTRIEFLILKTGGGKRISQQLSVNQSEPAPDPLILCDLAGILRFALLSQIFSKQTMAQ